MYQSLCTRHGRSAVRAEQGRRGAHLHPRSGTASPLTILPRPGRDSHQITLASVPQFGGLYDVGRSVSSGGPACHRLYRTRGSGSVVRPWVWNQQSPRPAYPHPPGLVLTSRSTLSYVPLCAVIGGKTMNKEGGCISGPRR